MAFVTEEPDQLRHALETDNDVPFACKILGIITIEDVIEELLKGDIFDEDDFDNVKDTIMSNLFRAYSSKDPRPATVSPFAVKILGALTRQATTREMDSVHVTDYKLLED